MKVNLAKIQEFYHSAIGGYVMDVLAPRINKFCCHSVPSEPTIIVSAGGLVPCKRLKKELDAVPFHVYKGDILPNGGMPSNNIVMCERQSWPYRAESIDRVVCMHDFEFAEKPDVYLREIWRVLKGEGQLLLILPNRGGRWARRDNTPFGQGYPFSPFQIEKLLNDTHFQIDKIEGALFFPPYEPKTSLGNLYRSLVERIGGVCLMNAGVYIIHVSKHIYAPTKGLKVMTTDKAKEFLSSHKPKPTIGRSLKNKHESCANQFNSFKLSLSSVS